MLRVLLDSGAEVNAESSAGTPLLWAAGSDNQEAVSTLLEAKADPNARTSEGVGAMLMAAAAGTRLALNVLPSPSSTSS